MTAARLFFPRFFAPLAIAAALAANAGAAPAPYYIWRSIPTGALACTQTSLGEAWVKASGPYRDARCKTPIIVK